MRQPIGLYLTEFAPSEARPDALAAALPCFDAPAPTGDDLPATFLFADTEVLAGDAEALVEPGLALPPQSGEEIAPAPDPAALVAALEAEHAAALEAARRDWAEQEGAALASGLAVALGEMETRIADTLAPLLEPLLVQGALATALAGLRTAIGGLLESGGAAITVSGPADLLAALRRGWADRPGLVFTETAAPDVTVAAGETRIRSQLASWADALEHALETPFGAPA